MEEVDGITRRSWKIYRASYEPLTWKIVQTLPTFPDMTPNKSSLIVFLFCSITTTFFFHARAQFINRYSVRTVHVHVERETMHACCNCYGFFLSNTSCLWNSSKQLALEPTYWVESRFYLIHIRATGHKIDKGTTKLLCSNARLKSHESQMSRGRLQDS